MIAIINYGMGNLGSVKRKLDLIKCPSVITNDPVEIGACDKLILPGVGHFGSAVQKLKNSGLWDALNFEVLINKKPILGICLGMQLMAKISEEGDSEGFGWFDAKVIRFKVQDTLKYKIPHMGWNQVSIEKPSELFNGIESNSEFYFVHSYHMVCANDTDVLNLTTYENSFVSGVQKNNIYGVQYHPEKSHDCGEQLLRNFSAINLTTD